MSAREHIRLSAAGHRRAGELVDDLRQQFERDARRVVSAPESALTPEEEAQIAVWFRGRPNSWLEMTSRARHEADRRSKAGWRPGRPIPPIGGPRG